MEKLKTIKRIRFNLIKCDYWFNSGAKVRLDPIETSAYSIHKISIYLEQHDVLHATEHAEMCVSVSFQSLKRYHGNQSVERIAPLRA